MNLETFLNATVYYTKDKDFIKESGIRWLLNEKKTSDKSNTLETLDWFIDLHLWFLPIPRFSKKGRERPLEEQSAKYYKTAVEKAIDFYSPDKPYNYNDEIEFYKALDLVYINLYPSITFLRTSEDYKKIALLLCLLALDAKTTSKIKSFDNIDIDAKKIIENEIGMTFKTITEMLERVSSFLNKVLILDLKTMVQVVPQVVPDVQVSDNVKQSPDIPANQVDTKVEPAEPKVEPVDFKEPVEQALEPEDDNIFIEFSCSTDKWTPYNYAAEMDLLNNNEINLALIHFARKHSLDLTECLNSAYIRNLAEEKIKIRICKK